MAITVLMSVTGHLAIPGIYNHLFLVPVLYVHCSQQATQQVLLGPLSGGMTQPLFLRLWTTYHPCVL